MKKREGDIASLFQKIAAKKNSSSSSIPLNDAIDHDGNIGPSIRTTGDSRISGGGDIVPSVNLIIDSRTSEENVDSSGTPTPSSMPPPPPPVYDPDRLPQDPAERLPIVSYPINDQDAVRRAYILKGPFKPYANDLKRKVVLGIGHSMLHGFTNIIDLNIVSRMMPHFALYASCSKGGGRKVILLIVDGEIGIEMMH
jgi:hypothetical protein